MSKAKFQEVHPVLPVRDVAAAIVYYTQKLGFELKFQDSKANPKYAGVLRDGVELHLQWHDATDFKSVEKLSLRFFIEDVDALFEEYQTQGVFHTRTALQNTSWGTREFAFYDPDGNGLFFYRGL